MFGSTPWLYERGRIIMSKSKKTSADKSAAKKPAAGSGKGASHVSDLTGAMMAGQPAAKAWMEIMNESARFVADRLQKDVEAQQALLQCKTPEDVVEVQTEFFQTAMTQYTEEAQRIFALMSGAAEEVVEDAKSGRKRGYDDVPV
jgi:hypothetical protein